MSKRKMPDTITGQLRWYVKHCGISTYQLERETGIDSGGLSRFIRGERGLHLDNIDVLGEHLGLRVVRDED